MKRDLRDYARQTNIRLILIGITLLYILGGGLIYLIYGPGAAISGILCLSIGLVPLLLIFIFLAIMDWIVKRANRD